MLPAARAVVPAAGISIPSALAASLIPFKADRNLPISAVGIPGAASPATPPWSCCLARTLEPSLLPAARVVVPAAGVPGASLSALVSPMSLSSEIAVVVAVASPLPPPWAAPLARTLEPALLAARVVVAESALLPSGRVVAPA
ncbi:hypothetical protein [Borrelia sp. RT5S]|uniref:hypothetical protein n=1 Tax=Borrelia sp. RT5S TaxID=2898581 RepID=UPI001E328927|nr:hypothetical protein [Borrelia sp. RT5S]UGQ16603.1 hypothetical protein LSO06_04635 [Borrelia sp. RT5S]